MQALVSWLLKHFSYRVWLCVILQVMMSALEGLGLLLIIPMLALLGHQLVYHPFLSKVSLAFRHFGFHLTLSTIIFTYFFIVCALALAMYFAATQTLRMSFQAQMLLQKSVFRCVTKAPWSFLKEKDSASLSQIATQAPSYMYICVSQCLNLSSTTIMAIIYLAIAALTNIYFVAVALFSMAALLVSYRFTNKYVVKLGMDFFDRSQKLYQELEQHFSSLKLAKVSGGERRVLLELEKVSEQMTQQQLQASSWNARTRLYFMLVSGAMLCCILWLGQHVFSLSFAQYILLAVIFVRLASRAQALQQGYQLLVGALPCVNASLKLIDECQDAMCHAKVSKAQVDLQQSIVMQDVGYQTDHHIILQAFNCSISAHSLVLLVGESGAGKTTLVDLIATIIAPTQGEIIVDGVNVACLDQESWREKNAYVDAKRSFKSGSVRSTLSLDCDYDDELMIAALKKVQLWSRLEKAGGLDFIMQGDATNLSSGEKQRLALAVVLIKKPRLLILDEALNALDLKTESEIFQLLQELKKQMTIIVISHRHTNMSMADQVIEL